MSGRSVARYGFFKLDLNRDSGLPAGLTILTCLTMLVCITLPGISHGLATDCGPLPPQPDLTHGRHPGLHYGGIAATASAVRDTLYLLGGPDRSDGKFQDPAQPTVPDPQGWAGWADWQDPSESYWHVDTFNAEPLDTNFDPNHAMWCGTTDGLCESDDAGYGNDWDEVLDWFGTVPATGATLHLTARLNHDTEPAYDFLTLELARADGWDVLLSFDGDNRTDDVFVPVDVDVTCDVLPEDLVGPDLDQAHLRWRFTSDGGWSDEDCLYDSDGAAQIDNITVELLDTGPPVLLTFDDFEPDSELNWTPGTTQSACSYAQVWSRLRDLDLCHENTTPQFAFVDDGSQCGGPGSPGVVWTYGPGGYVIHYETDGFIPEVLFDEVWSPPLAWPAGDLDSAILAFDVYQHSTLLSGQFVKWAVRNSTDGGATWGGWRDFNFVYYDEGPEYSRRLYDLSSLLEPDRTHLQLSLGYFFLGWIWGWDDPDDLTPAPYYDNVSLKVYANGGPAMTTRTIDQAQDAFPAIGTVNWENLGENSVRFDMAQNISPAVHQRNDPGDSIVIDAAAVRAGAVLDGPPQMHWRLWPNPLFDPYRTASAPNPVPGAMVHNAIGDPVPDRWSFDLPDSGLLFPGDIIHYYFLARDNAGGDIGTTLLPADTTGFSQLPGVDSQVCSAYPDAFTMRALPTMREGIALAQPGILLWYDQGDLDGLNLWTFSLANLGFRAGTEYDLFLTKGAASGMGNGLGGRATPVQAAGYEVILYTSGDLSHFTLSTGDYNADPSDDVGLLTNWLLSGDKSLLATGDHLAAELATAAPAGQAFATEVLGIDFIGNDLKPLIDQQTSPVVAPMANAPIFHATDRWFIYGGCPGLRRFDALQATAPALRLAEFLAPDGAPGTYPLGAAILHEIPTVGATVVSLPYDLDAVRTVTGGDGPDQLLAARTHLLGDILTYFGQAGSTPTEVPSASALTSRIYPNPFNPRVTIEYLVPFPDRLSIGIYNLRGQLVRNLLDESVQPGPGIAVWDGRDTRGGSAASGVYFAEVRLGAQVQVHKLALVR